MFRILSLFDFQILDCGKHPKHEDSAFMDVSGTAEYGLNNYFSINDIASNRKFKKLLTSWMFRQSFLFAGASVIDGFDVN